MEFNNIIYKLWKDPISIQVLSVLLKHSEGISGRALSALVGVSTFKMHHTLKFLESQGILKHSVAGRSHLYRVHLDHILVQEVILPILDFQETVFSRLGKEIQASLKPKPLSIILYGSVARGEEKPDSDLDLFLVYKDAHKAAPISESNLFMEKITRKYGNAVSVRRNFVSILKGRYKKRDELIRNILKEGKVIAGLSVVELLDYGC